MCLFRNAFLIVLLFATGFSSAIAQRLDKCLLEINQHKYIDGQCFFELEQDGSFILRDAQKNPTYFAIVNVENNNAQGYWNEDPKATYAQTSLGKLKRKGAGWQNESAKVCAWN